MLSNKYRFHGHGSLRFVYQHGKNIRGQLFAIKVIENKRRETFRLAVVVSKKVSKSAVVRNRIRRRIYELVREEYDINAPFDIVITVFSDSVATMEHQKIKINLQEQLRQAGVIS
ncbi:ribonuclease P protein component [Candidatus Saccharibacteria bacterium]|nr:ribonuclease P protein component [Candidatus Saccharibacteria bacterium]